MWLDGRGADFTENGESGGVMEGSGEERAGDGESIGAACCAIVAANWCRMLAIGAACCAIACCV